MILDFFRFRRQTPTTKPPKGHYDLRVSKATGALVLVDETGTEAIVGGAGDVTSVAGRTGAVVLVSSDITDITSDGSANTEQALQANSLGYLTLGRLLLPPVGAGSNMALIGPATGSSSPAPSVYLPDVTGETLLSANFAATTTAGALYTFASTSGSAVEINVVGLTSGDGLVITGGGAGMSAFGSLMTLNMDGAVNGNAIQISHATGDYVGAGLVDIEGDGILTGTMMRIAGNNLTTGKLLGLDSSSIITDGGSMLRLTASGVNTGGATNATVFDIASTNQAAGLVARISALGLTSGTAMQLATTNLTSGTILELLAGGAGMGTGAVGMEINLDGATDGTGFYAHNATGTFSANGYYARFSDGGGDIFSVGEGGETKIAGSLILNGNNAIAADTEGALPLTSATQDITTGAGAEAFTIAAGTPGQIMTCVLRVNGGGAATITPTSAFIGGTSVALTNVGASVVFQFIVDNWFLIGGHDYVVNA